MAHIKLRCNSHFNKKKLIIIIAIVSAIIIIGISTFFIVKAIINKKINEAVEQIKTEIVIDQVQGKIITTDNFIGKYSDSDVYVLEIFKEHYTDEYLYETTYNKTYTSKNNYYMTYDFNNKKIKKFCGEVTELDIDIDNLRNEIFSTIKEESGWSETTLAKCKFVYYEKVATAEIKITNLEIKEKTLSFDLLINDETTISLLANYQIILDEINIDIISEYQKEYIYIINALKTAKCIRYTYNEDKYYSVLKFNNNIIVKGLMISD